MRRSRGRAARRVLPVAAVLVAGLVLSGCVVLRPPPAPGVYRELGFDTCEAPNPGQMQQWTASPYHTIGIYIGGANRACGNSQLSPGWVSAVASQGWHLAPLYVGLQAPCSGIGATIAWDQGIAAQQGADAADNAVANAQAIGLGGGTPIYFDMEAYSTGGACTTIVLDFMNQWDYHIRAHGYIAGFYSSSASGIRDQAAQVNNPGYQLPDDMWFANWDGRGSVYGDPFFADNLWNLNQRIHQYQGGHVETWGGLSLNIDNDAVDGLVAA